MDSQYKVIEFKVKQGRIIQKQVSNIIAYASIATIVAPLATLGTSLQLSSPGLEKFYEKTTSEITKLQLAKSYDMAVKERRLNELQLSSGMVGTNKPFRAPFYLNYRQAALALSAQGFQGFYKGNFIDTLRFSSSTFPKIYVVNQDMFVNTLSFIKFFAVFAVDCIGELVTQPLQNARTRFILQNRIPQFSVYRSLYRFFDTLGKKELFQGYNVIIPKNITYYTFLMAGFEDPMMRLFGFFVALTCIYPLETVQRRLEAQSVEHSMLPRRYLDEVRWALSKIYHEDGLFKGLYRGYFCNILANSSRLLMFPIISSWLFTSHQEKKYIEESWGLIT